MVFPFCEPQYSRPFFPASRHLLILAYRYFHGLLGSRLESNFDSQSSLVHGVLFISVDRPGYGLSTYSPKRGYLDFVQDIEELLNYLALPKVLAIGFSSGGPYALACAARIPERLIGCSVVISDLPYADLSPELVKELKGDLKSLNTVFNVAKVPFCFSLPLLFVVLLSSSPAFVVGYPYRPQGQHSQSLFQLP